MKICQKLHSAPRVNPYLPQNAISHSALATPESAPRLKNPGTAKKTATFPTQHSLYHQKGSTPMAGCLGITPLQQMHTFQLPASYAHANFQSSQEKTSSASRH